MKPTTLRVTSTVLLRWIRDHSGEDFQPSMVVIANDWTTEIVWAQLATLCRCPPFWDAPEPPPGQALIQRPAGLSFIHCYPICSPLPMDGSIRRYGLTACGQYYLEALENPDSACGPYLRMALKHPEIESAEALAIFEAVPAWKKMLGWLGVVGVHVTQRKEWVLLKLREWAWHIFFIMLTETIFYVGTGHELVWWIIHFVSRLK